MIDACRPCTCQQAIGGSGQQAKCGGKELTEVPSTLPNDTCRLDISENRITTIEENAISALANLKNLYLSENRITTIEDDMFSGLTNLKYLYLDKNRITTITNSIFTGLTKLFYLTLRDNTITTIEAFRDLTKLEFLDLSINRITTIKNITISGWTNLEIMKLHDNPYHCDCELIGLVDFLKSGSVSVYENQCCFTPAKLNGTELVSLSAANLTCSEMTTMETNSSPLKVGDFLVTAQLFLYLLVKTLI